MSVIAEVRVPAHQFSVGKSLRLEGDTTVEFDRLVPGAGERTPIFSFEAPGADSLADRFRATDAVSRLDVVDVLDDRTLYTLTWEYEADPFFRTVRELDGHVLRGVGTDEWWRFEIRFAGHDALSSFQDACEDRDLSLRLDRIIRL